MNNDAVTQGNMTGQSPVPANTSGDGHMAGNPVSQDFDSGVEQKVAEVKDAFGNSKGTVVVNHQADRAT